MKNDNTVFISHMVVKVYGSGWEGVGGVLIRPSCLHGPLCLYIFVHPLPVSQDSAAGRTPPGRRMAQNNCQVRVLPITWADLGNFGHFKALSHGLIAAHSSEGKTEC